LGCKVKDIELENMKIILIKVIILYQKVKLIGYFGTEWVTFSQLFNVKLYLMSLQNRHRTWEVWFWVWYLTSNKLPKNISSTQWHCCEVWLG